MVLPSPNPVINSGPSNQYEQDGAVAGSRAEATCERRPGSRRSPGPQLLRATSSSCIVSLTLQPPPKQVLWKAPSSGEKAGTQAQQRSSSESKLCTGSTAPCRQRNDGGGETPRWQRWKTAHPFLNFLRLSFESSPSQEKN